MVCGVKILTVLIRLSAKNTRTNFLDFDNAPSNDVRRLLAKNNDSKLGNVFNCCGNFSKLLLDARRNLKLGATLGSSFSKLSSLLALTNNQHKSVKSDNVPFKCLNWFLPRCNFEMVAGMESLSILEI